MLTGAAFCVIGAIMRKNLELLYTLKPGEEGTEELVKQFVTHSSLCGAGMTRREICY